jgi:phage gp36-like protein
MSYATPADFEQTYGVKEALQLSNRGVSNPLAVDTARLQAGLDAASGLIDSYLSGRYPLPLSPVQAEPLKIHCLRLARCELDNISIRDKCQADCDRTYDWLMAVAKGAIELGQPGLPQEPDLAGSTTGARGKARGRKTEGIDLSGYNLQSSYGGDRC